MSARVRLIGTIGGGSMAPASSVTQEGRPPFMRFQMFVPDETRPLDPKNSSRPSQVYKVILRNEKLFKYLIPGRQVLIEGRLGHEARALVKNDDLIAYPNPTVQMDRLQFLSPQEDVQLERSLNRLAKLDIMDKEAAKDYTVRARKAIMEQYEKEPPQRYSNKPTTPPEVSSDPDHPDFAK